MSWLVTGGAGYIGAHVLESLDVAGLEPVAFDNLSTGLRRFVHSHIPFIEGDVLDTDLVERTLREHSVSGVIHLAGYKYAGESVNRPLHAYHQNVEGTRSVLDAMQRAGVRRMVFSSSAAVYGTPNVPIVEESTAEEPTSPYGESKLIGEWMLRDLTRSGSEPPFLHTSLRYFNVVGSRDGRIYDQSAFNLFPRAFRALMRHGTPTIYGTDYETPDGSAVRDYVHVSDIADAHAAAAARLMGNIELLPAYNLGSGSGLSVRQVLSAIRAVTGISFEPAVEPRRHGDPDRIIASGAAAERDLGWSMKHTVTEMVSSAWAAHRSATSARPQD